MASCRRHEVRVRTEPRTMWSCPALQGFSLSGEQTSYVQQALPADTTEGHNTWKVFRPLPVDSGASLNQCKLEMLLNHLLNFSRPFSINAWSAALCCACLCEWLSHWWLTRYHCWFHMGSSNSLSTGQSRHPPRDARLLRLFSYCCSAHSTYKQARRRGL